MACHSLHTAPQRHPHIVPLPRSHLILRLLQLFFATTILIFLSITTAAWGRYSELIFGVFVSSATIILVLYHMSSTAYWPVWYNRWAVLGLDIFGIIFWLAGFASMGEWYSATSWMVWSYRSYYGNWPTTRRFVGVCAGLGSIEFVLFIVSLVRFSINLDKHRKQGNYSMYGGARTMPTENLRTPDITITEMSQSDQSNSGIPLVYKDVPNDMDDAMNHEDIMKASSRPSMRSASPFEQGRPVAEVV